jgi:hypothetical protein
MKYNLPNGLLCRLHFCIHNTVVLLLGLTGYTLDYLDKTLFPRKYCNRNHIQSQLFQRRKMIFYNDKLIYTQNLKFYLNNFTELRNDFVSLR